MAMTSLVLVLSQRAKLAIKTYATVLKTGLKATQTPCGTTETQQSLLRG